MQSLKARFKDQIPDILDHTRQYGRFPAMTEFGIKCYDSFVNFLTEETNDPNFGISPIKPLRISYRPLDMQLAQAYLHKVSVLKAEANLRAEGKRLDKRIESLQLQLLEAGEIREAESSLELSEILI